MARAAAASAIPLISAVGHETDTTLIDYVSDRRAPTPTAAAELAVPVRRDLLAWLAEQDARLLRAMAQAVTRRRQRVADLSRALPRPEALLASARQRLDAADRALPLMLRGVTRARAHRLTELSAVLRPTALRAQIGRKRGEFTQWGDRHGPALARHVGLKRRDLGQVARRLDPARLHGRVGKEARALDSLTARLASTGRARLAALSSRLDALDRTRRTLGYEATLARGYALVWEDGRLVPGKADLGGATMLEVQFRDGRLPVVVGGSEPSKGPTGSGSPGPQKAGRQKTDPDKPEQGSLF